MTSTVSFITSVVGGHVSAYDAASGVFMPDGTLIINGNTVVLSRSSTQSGGGSGRGRMANPGGI